MKVMMLHPSHGEWQAYPSLRAARDRFWSDADEALNRYGQSEESWSEAWVVAGHFETPAGDEYPNWILHYNQERDSVRVERT